MMNHKIAYLLLLSGLSSGILSMQKKEAFRFEACIQNQSKKTISYTHTKGEFESDYKEGAKLSQDIPNGTTLGIVRGKGKFTDMWLDIAGQRHALSSMPTVFERNDSAGKIVHKGYQIKFDGQNVAQVVEGERVCVKVDADDNTSFEVLHDINYYLLRGSAS